MVRGWALARLAEVADARGGHAAAEVSLEESLRIWRENGNRNAEASTLEIRGRVALHQGEAQRARQLYRESLAIRQDRGDRLGVAEVLVGLAGVALAQGQLTRAARLFGAAEALRAADGTPLPPVASAEYGGQVLALRTALGEEPFAAAWAAGRAMSLQEAISFALDEVADA